jgi:hypothetical protein
VLHERRLRSYEPWHAPSAFAVELLERKSAKYHLVPTVEVIDHLRVNGFQPARATQGRTCLPGKQDYTRHDPLAPEQLEHLADVTRALMMVRQGLVLEAMIVLANVVKGGERCESLHVALGQTIELTESREPLAQQRTPQQGFGYRRDVGAVVGERMPFEPTVLAACELSPKTLRWTYITYDQNSDSG